MARALEIGVQAASIETGFPARSLRQWRWQMVGATRPLTSDEDKAAGIQLAEQIGVNEAARRLGVHACQISRWRRAAGLPPIGASSAKGITLYPRAFITRALKRADRVGIPIAAEQLGVATSTLSRWRRDRRRADIQP